MEPLIVFYPEGHAAHSETGHPERPERLEAARRGLEEAGWWSQIPKVEPVVLSQDILQAVHTPGLLKELQIASRSGERLDADTYTTPESWDLALRAAGGAAAVAQAVWRRETAAGYALCRPPGHHATPSRAMGFCLLNNVALAAEHLIQKEGARRLAVIDLDLHHGNGTQEIFYPRGDVFFLSVHQSPLYPGTGFLDETGVGAGKGLNANFPLPPGSGDQAFQALLGELILPLLHGFRAEMLLVSLGFDVHWRDPLGGLQLSSAVLGGLIRDLAAWAGEQAGGRIALFLEGGYDLQAMAVGSQAVVAALLGQDWHDPLGPAPTAETGDWEKNAARARKIWGLS